jgi:mRNA interferase MazF
MLKPGDVVLVDFIGAQGTKPRPSVIVSTDTYHLHRPDIVIAALTGNLAAATAPTDYALQDWAAAGLHRPSAFRVYLNTTDAGQVRFLIGHLTDRDWAEVQARLRVGLAVM